MVQSRKKKMRRKSGEEWRPDFRRVRGRPKTRWQERKKAKNPQLVILEKGEEEKLRRLDRKIAQTSSGGSLPKTDELGGLGKIARRRRGENCEDTEAAMRRKGEEKVVKKLTGRRPDFRRTRRDVRNTYWRT